MEGTGDQMRQSLILIIIVGLMGCVTDEVPIRQNPIHWNFNKHKNTTEVLTPIMRADYGFYYRLHTVYTHTEGLQSRMVSATPPVLSVSGANRITAAHSYGEEFSMLGENVLVSRSKLKQYAKSSRGWELGLTMRGITYPIHIPSNYIKKFLAATPDCEASKKDCRLFKPL